MQILEKIFNNQDAIAAAIFCGSAVVGQILNAVKMWANGDADGIGVWFSSNIKRTIAAVIGNLGGMVIFVQTGVLGPILALPNGLWAVFAFGFLNGFSADSGLNKGIRQQWTAAQRKEMEKKDGN